MDLNRRAAREPGTGHSTSEKPDGEWQMNRRTYLKGAVATGLAASLAGCLGTIEETYESTVVGLNPEWAASSAYVSADHLAAESTLEKSGDVFNINITVVNHAVTYAKEETASGFSSATGAVTTPIPTFIGFPQASWNPYAVTSIQDLVEGENAKPLLEGLGIDVGEDVDWEAGPTHEVQEPGGMTLMDSPVENLVLTHGVLRTGNTLRAVLLLIARVKRDDPAEVLFAGVSHQQIVKEGVGSESFRDEYAESITEAFAPPSENLQKIDPTTDLELLS